MATNIDSRKLPDDVREEMRREIIQRRSQGETNRAAARAVGISERHSSMIWQSYLRSEDVPLFVWQRRGRRKGEQRSISPAQELSLLSMLLNEPAKMKFRSGLWTRQLFQRSIKRRVNIDVPIRTVSEYLKRWGLIPQKPIGITSVTNSTDVQDWLCGDYQDIVERAKGDGGEIHWLVVKSLGGHTAKIYDDLLLLKKKKAAMLIASITNKGQIRFMLSRREISSDLLIEFMTRLIVDASRKVFLLLRPIMYLYHVEKVNDWLAENKAKIELVYLPAGF